MTFLYTGYSFMISISNHLYDRGEFHTMGLEGDSRDFLHPDLLRERTDKKKKKVVITNAQ